MTTIFTSTLRRWCSRRSVIVNNNNINKNNNSYYCGRTTSVFTRSFSQIAGYMSPSQTHDELLKTFPDYKQAYTDELNGKFGTGIINMKRCLEILQAVMGKDSHFALHANIKLANLHNLNGDYDKALVTLNDNILAKDELESCLGHQFCAQLKYLQGNMQGALDDVDKSIQILTSSSKHSNSSSDSGISGISGISDIKELSDAANAKMHVSLGLKGLCSYHLDNYPEAIKCLSAAVKLGTKFGTVTSLLAAHNNLGVLAFHRESSGSSNSSSNSTSNSSDSNNSDNCSNDVVSGRRLIWRLKQYFDSVPLADAFPGSSVDTTSTLNNKTGKVGGGNAIVEKNLKEVLYDENEEAKTTTDRSDMADRMVLASAKEALRIWDEGSMMSLKDKEDSNGIGEGRGGGGSEVVNSRKLLDLSNEKNDFSDSDLEAAAMLVKESFNLEATRETLNLYRRMNNLEYCQILSAMSSNCAEAFETIGEYRNMDESIQYSLSAIDDFAFHKSRCSVMGIRPLQLKGSSYFHRRDPIIAEGLFRAAQDLYKSPIATNDLRYRYDCILLKASYGKLLTKWVKREPEGYKMLDEAYAELVKLPRFANNKVYLTNAFVLPLQI